MLKLQSSSRRPGSTGSGSSRVFPSYVTWGLRFPIGRRDNHTSLRVAVDEMIGLGASAL